MREKGVGDDMVSEHGKESQKPLVSVLTPVYNGESHLVECIESVLHQTYHNWEYIIVNNCSTDRTPEIIADYANRDRRIRAVHNTEFVGAVKNHNIALSRISSNSKYAKFVQADDFLFPNCLEEMVAVAEAHPSSGIVTSYQLRDRRVHNDGWPYTTTFVPGHEVCRQFFLEGKVPFGNMTSFLLRSDLIHARPLAFFNEQYLFADTEAYFAILQNHDYAFVHQVLSFHRMPDNSLSSYGRRHNEWSFAVLYFTKTYGHIYLTPGEYKRCWKRSLNQYYRCQGHELFHLRERSYWQYHRERMQELGYSLSLPHLLKGAVSTLADILLGPVKAVGRILRSILGNRAHLRSKVARNA
jgi:glycosyltransferase involved in cell wall biosynthesis